MAEDQSIVIGSKEEQYETLLPQVEALIKAESDPIANMANVAAALKTQFNWLWVGFYRIGEDCLILGPFQGPIACTRILKGKGVCGKAWDMAETIVVPDVTLFPGHIACSSLSRSEIVVPVLSGGSVKAVLDVDSEALNYFDEVDRYYLEKLVSLLPGL